MGFKMKDVVLDTFLKRYAIRLRSASSLEKLRDGSKYFALEMQRDKHGKPTYLLHRSDPTDGGDCQLPIKPSVLADTLRQSMPFVPALLKHYNKMDWAAKADAMFRPSPDTSFLYDGLVLRHVQLFVQYDWEDVSVPDGFKLSVKFHNEPNPTYYPIHNDVVAVAVEMDESPLKMALQICPAVVAKLVLFEDDLQAEWEASELRQVAMPAAVSGHAHRL